MRKFGVICSALVLLSMILTSCTSPNDTAAAASVQPTTATSTAQNALANWVTDPISDTQPTPATNPTKTKGKRIFLGYYVPYDSTSWASLEAQADNIDYVATQTVSVDACGNVGTTDDLDLNKFAAAHNIGVIPSVFTTSGSVNHTILTSDTLSAKVIQQLVDYVVKKGYPGLDLDLEGVNATDRQAFTAFVAKASQALHAQGKTLTLAVPAKTTDTTTGWSGAYEYAALAPYADYFVIMAYAYTTSSSTEPGSTAPYSWVAKVAAYTTSQIPAEKVLLGVAFYGYDWNMTAPGRARALRYDEAQAVFSAYKTSPALDPTARSATFTYIAKQNDPAIQYPKAPILSHQIETVNRPQCGAPATPEPQPQVTPVPPKPTAWPQQHEVWLEDAASVAQRLNLARDYGVGGVAAWRLGQEDPATWPKIVEYRQGK
jgi:spore germination protein YaaH